MNASPNMAGGAGKMQAAEARRDLQRSQETRTSFWRAAIVSSFFVVVVGASLFLGAVMMIGTFRDQESELRADGRATRIARALPNGTLCHYVVIDNRTAQAVEDRIGRCDENKPKPKPVTIPTFRWGGG
jgi:vacuolar-type H+-ATPase subunit F/Vma7